MGKKVHVPAVIRNVVETPWKQFPGHFGGALSKPLVRPETTCSKAKARWRSPASGRSCAGTT